METNQTSLLDFWPGSRLRKAFTHTTGFLSRNSGLFQILTTLFLTSFFSTKAFSQDKKQLVRLARLVIDSTQLERYKAALTEETEASVRLEPGVMTLYAVSEKDKPTHFTILEIYADTNAYKAHLKTPHFINYKTITKDMVKSLELIETVPLVPGMKIK